LIIEFKKKFYGRRTVFVSFDPNESGQGLVEYALIIILVAIIVWVIIALLGPWIGDYINDFLQSI